MLGIETTTSSTCCRLSAHSTVGWLIALSVGLDAFQRPARTRPGACARAVRRQRRPRRTRDHRPGPVAHVKDGEAYASCQPLTEAQPSALGSGHRRISHGPRGGRAQPERHRDAAPAGRLREIRATRIGEPPATAAAVAAGKACREGARGADYAGRIRTGHDVRQTFSFGAPGERRRRRNACHVPSHCHRLQHAPRFSVLRVSEKGDRKRTALELHERHAERLSSFRRTRVRDLAVERATNHREPAEAAPMGLLPPHAIRNAGGTRQASSRERLEAPSSPRDLPI